MIPAALARCLFTCFFVCCCCCCCCCSSSRLLHHHLPVAQVVARTTSWRWRLEQCTSTVKKEKERKQSHESWRAHVSNTHIHACAYCKKRWHHCGLKNSERADVMCNFDVFFFRGVGLGLGRQCRSQIFRQVKIYLKLEEARLRALALYQSFCNNVHVNYPPLNLIPGTLWILEMGRAGKK